MTDDPSNYSIDALLKLPDWKRKTILQQGPGAPNSAPSQADEIYSFFSRAEELESIETDILGPLEARMTDKFNLDQLLALTSRSTELTDRLRQLRQMHVFIEKLEKFQRAPTEIASLFARGDIRGATLFLSELHPVFRKTPTSWVILQTYQSIVDLFTPLESSSKDDWLIVFRQILKISHPTAKISREPFELSLLTAQPYSALSTLHGHEFFSELLQIPSKVEPVFARLMEMFADLKNILPSNWQQKYKTIYEKWQLRIPSDIERELCRVVCSMPAADFFALREQNIAARFMELFQRSLFGIAVQYLGHIPERLRSTPVISIGWCEELGSKFRFCLEQPDADRSLFEMYRDHWYNSAVAVSVPENASWDITFSLLNPVDDTWVFKFAGEFLNKTLFGELSEADAIAALEGFFRGRFRETSTILQAFEKTLWSRMRAGLQKEEDPGRWLSRAYVLFFTRETLAGRGAADEALVRDRAEKFVASARVES
jgi:hypothetical protein